MPDVHFKQRRDEVRAAAIANAILHRADPENHPLTAEGARDFMGMSLIEVAREVLEAGGVSTRGMSRQEVAAAALQTRGGMHSADDFPAILSGVTRKSLMQGYTAAPQTFRPFVRIGFASDFKEISRTQISEAPPLERIAENGEFPYGTMGEASERFRLETYGKIIAITRQVIVNDDVDAFVNVPREFGKQASQLESDVVWAQLISNPTMGDGHALFSQKHKNMMTPAPIGKAAIGDALVKMGLQTGIDRRTILNLSPAFILVPKSLQTDAEAFLTPLRPTKAEDAVPHSLQKLQIISEPRLDNGIARYGIPGTPSTYYFAADPGLIDLIELCYLDGETGVNITTRTGFDVDGVEIRARLDVAAKAIDWRGFLRNSGQ